MEVEALDLAQAYAPSPPELHREPPVWVTEAFLNLLMAGIIMFISLPCPQKLYSRGLLPNRSL